MRRLRRVLTQCFLRASEAGGLVHSRSLGHSQRLVDSFAEPGWRMEKPGGSSWGSRYRLASPSGAAVKCARTCAFTSIRKRAMGGGSSTVGIAAAPTPPRHTKLLARVVGRRWVRAQEVSHLRTQGERRKLGIGIWVHHVCPLSGSASRAGARSHGGSKARGSQCSGGSRGTCDNGGRAYISK
jgi:hypothetical protein